MSGAKHFSRITVVRNCAIRLPHPRRRPFLHAPLDIARRRPDRDSDAYLADSIQPAEGRIQIVAPRDRNWEHEPSDAVPRDLEFLTLSRPFSGDDISRRVDERKQLDPPVQKRISWALGPRVPSDMAVDTTAFRRLAISANRFSIAALRSVDARLGSAI